jgi:cytoskeletal protein CcmA (bactofilin family)
MMKKQVNTAGDLIINGIGYAAAGHYSHVDINGVGTLNGDIFSQSMKANGRIKALGAIRTYKLDCDGTLKVEGNLQAEETRIDGTAKVEGSLSGEKLELRGLLNIAGDCELEQFNVQGGFTIGGLLNVGKLDLDVFARSQVREIGGEFIRVRKTSGKWKGLWKWVLPSFTPELQVSVIEGDVIELEMTTASIVRGNRIIIGKGCSIGRVEYSGELKVLPGATVGEEIRIHGDNNLS